jgi:hypothetical protein
VHEKKSKETIITVERVVFVALAADGRPAVHPLASRPAA